MSDSSAPIKPPRKSKLMIDIGQMPTLPTNLKKIQRVANSHDVAIKEVESVVTRDPALAVRVLQAANSAFYGTRGIGTIHRSMQMLGVKEVQSLASGMKTAPTFGDAVQESELLDGTQLWRHSIGVALWTGVVAKRVKFIDTNTLFTWGLLHDIGLLVFSRVCPSALEAALRLVQGGTHSLEEAEMEVLKITHTQLCDSLCQKWMLPAEIGQQLAIHHSFKMQQTPAGRIFALAEYLAHCSGLGEFTWDDTPKSRPGSLLKLMELTDKDVDELLDRAPQIHAKIDAYLGEK